MNKIIASWVCVDTEEGGTWFPSSKGNSADTSVQNIYWRCICCFYAMARHYNPNASLALFSNVERLPEVDGVAVEYVLKKLNVKFYSTPFEFITPEGYYKQWRNQFYEFSIFKFVSTHTDFSENDILLLLDSDCIITSNLNSLFQKVQDIGCITYVIDYNTHHKINGNSRSDMKAIFEELSDKPLDTFPDYHAGEFYASTVAVCRKIVADFYVVWENLLARHFAGLDKLHEEAHVLSYLYYINGFKGGEANQYIKRLWTDPSAYRNVERGDSSLMIWHLPAEKRVGFRRLYHWLQKKDFDTKMVQAFILRSRLERTFQIPDIPFRRKPYYLVKSMFKKLIQ